MSLPPELIDDEVLDAAVIWLQDNTRGGLIKLVLLIKSAQRRFLPD